jgi:hypothetical protein
MAKYPFTPNPNNVKELFEKIQTIGVPKVKVNMPFLKSLGFKSSYDTYLPPVLKFLGFISGDGTPSTVWQSYGVKAQARSVMASALKTSYSELFHTYNDANNIDDQTLSDFFKGQTGESDKNTGLIVQTFKVICDLSDFETVSEVGQNTTVSIPPLKTKNVGETLNGTKPITVNINIQLQLPATEDAKIYDSLFKSLKEHLFT